MRAFKDYNTTEEYTDWQRLPAGAYEVDIIRAEDSEKALCLLFDIAEGEFAGYYRQKFASERKSPNITDAKFRGVFRLWYPDGGQYDDNKKRRMKTALKLITEENGLSIDFTREWDGAALKGAHIGMIFRDTEWEFGGRRGMTAQPFTLIATDRLRAGEFELPEPKYLSKPNQPSFNDYPAQAVSADDDLLF